MHTHFPWSLAMTISLCLIFGSPAALAQTATQTESPAGEAPETRSGDSADSTDPAAQDEKEKGGGMAVAKTELDKITVRGTALNFANSVNGKRAADNIVDRFDVDEIGRYPDKNIGETLNRIPGVSMLLEKGEGRFVQIRGISPRLNNVTINGVAIGSGETDDGGRLTPLDVIGGELLSSVEVSKTRTPDMDGQGIGGTLDITTKQPFDYPEDFVLLVNGRAGIESIDNIEPVDTKETPWTADLTAAGKTADQRFGWLAGASFSNRKTPLLGAFQDDWRPVTFDPDESITGDEQVINLPENVKNNVTVVSRERLNLNGAFEFRPNAASRYYLRTFYTEWDELQLRNRFEQGLSDNLTELIDDSSGVISGNRVQVNQRSEPTEKELLSAVIGGENFIGNWTADYLLQRNDNDIDEPNTFWEFRSGSRTFGPDTFSITDDGLVTISSAGPDRQDPGFQTFRRVRFQEKRSQENTWIGQLNLRRDLALDFADESYLKFGGKWTRTERDTGFSRTRFDLGSQAWTLAFDPNFNLGGFTNPVPIQSQPNLWIDMPALNAFFEANRDNPDFFKFNEEDTFRNEFQSDFKLRERVFGAYAMGKLAIDRWSVIGGLRIETTNVSSSAFTIVEQNDVLRADPIAAGGKYTNILPTVLATFGVTDDVLIRAGWTRAVGRPEFDQLAPRSSLLIEDDPTVGTVGTLSIGNPDLEARESDNLDLSLEWYFDEGSLFSVALFYKDIAKEIVPAPEQRFENFEFQGQVFDRFEIATTINAQAAEVKGIEINFIDKFEFLPAPFDGLGFAGSVTFLDSEIDIERNGEVETLPLLEQADSSISLTLYYQKNRWDLAVTYTRNDNFLTDFGPTRELDLDQGAFGRIDARVQYNLTDNLKLFVEGINLNNEPTTEFQGGIGRQNTEFEFTGRTFFSGLAARF